MADVALILAGCTTSRAARQEAVTLRVAGSTSMHLALQDLADNYQANHPNTIVDIRTGGSAVGLSGLMAAKADIAAVSWHAKDAEILPGLQAIPIARDAIAVIVHPSNPVRGLTLLQIKGLYQGEILGWETLGGTTDEPLLISREDGSGTREAFEAMVMGGERVTLNALVMPGSQAVVDYVAAHPTAIGYVSAAYSERESARPGSRRGSPGRSGRSDLRLSPDATALPVHAVTSAAGKPGIREFRAQPCRAGHHRQVPRRSTLRY